MATDSNLRFNLDGLPRVGFYRGGDQAPESVPFPSCLAAVVRYLGNDYPWIDLEAHGKVWRLNYAYVHILAQSGMAFGLRWKRGWHLDNDDRMFVADPAEIIRRAFAAAGYRYRIISRQGGPDDRSLYQDEIVASLHRGMPILAFGLVGPPECSLITGYDEGGDVMIGWSFFQDLPPWNAGLAYEPSGQVRKRDWFGETHSLVLVEERAERQDDLRETIRWAAAVAQQPTGLWGEPTGLAAYQAWAEQMGDDAAFQGQDERQLRELHLVHDAQVGSLAECRAWAAEFLKFQAERYPEMAPDLREAARWYAAVHDLMWEVWEQTLGHQHPDAWQHFARPEVRKAIEPMILRARDLDAKAIAHLESALTR